MVTPRDAAQGCDAEGRPAQDVEQGTSECYSQPASPLATNIATPLTRLKNP